MPDLRTSDGLCLRYTDWGDPAAAVPVILHHGFGINSIINWVLPGVVDLLVSAGHRVLALDARGHGESDKPHDPARYGEQRMADDLIGLIDFLGVGQVDLVGYSMGAIITLLVAAHDCRVRKLVAGGVGAGVVEVGGVDTRAVDNKAIHRALLAEDVAALTGPEAVFRQTADMVRADRAALAAQVQVMYRGGIDLAAVTPSTLVVAGDDDPLAVRPEALAAAISDATVAVLAGDHQSVVMNPLFAQTIRDFLDDAATPVRQRDHA